MLSALSLLAPDAALKAHPIINIAQPNEDGYEHWRKQIDCNVSVEVHHCEPTVERDITWELTDHFVLNRPHDDPWNYVERYDIENGIKHLNSIGAKVDLDERVESDHLKDVRHRPNLADD